MIIIWRDYFPYLKNKFALSKNERVSCYFIYKLVKAEKPNLTLTVAR